MKRILLLVSVIGTILLAACGKSESGCQPQSPALEKDSMVAYCVRNNISYSELPNGLLYQIVDPGNGVNPTLSSTVSFVYTGTFLNGTVFDASATAITYPLSSLIDGWKVGMQLIQKGGRIKLIIPSALAYSCTGSRSIPPNTPLFFDVTLSDVK
jgi:FKBP-type peptidyl-prolyl cis-trans isomerase